MEQEVVEKERTDEQWNKYRTASKESTDKKPSQKQIAYIISLAKSVGIRINIEKIDSNTKASSLIQKLKLVSQQINGSNGYELRDKRVAFGMATKLVFRKYMDMHKDYKKSKSFWKEVEELYQQYQERQKTAIAS